MAGPPLVQVVEPRLKAYVVCPHCRRRQPFVKEKEHWRTVHMTSSSLFFPLLRKVVFAPTSPSPPNGAGL